MLPALIVGGLTAWYLGLRVGIIVGVATAIAMILAIFVPGMTMAVYALVIAWAAALYFFGPKLSKAAGKSTLVGGAFGQAKSWAASLFSGLSKKQ